jgi:hypothetical protein
MLVRLRTTDVVPWKLTIRRRNKFQSGSSERDHENMFLISSRPLLVRCAAATAAVWLYKSQYDPKAFRPFTIQGNYSTVRCQGSIYTVNSMLGTLAGYTEIIPHKKQNIAYIRCITWHDVQSVAHTKRKEKKKTLFYQMKVYTQCNTISKQPTKYTHTYYNTEICTSSVQSVVLQAVVQRTAVPMAHNSVYNVLSTLKIKFVKLLTGVGIHTVRIDGDFKKCTVSASRPRPPAAKTRPHNSSSYRSRKLNCIYRIYETVSLTKNFPKILLPITAISVPSRFRSATICYCYSKTYYCIKLPYLYTFTKYTFPRSFMCETLLVIQNVYTADAHVYNMM